MKIKRRGFIASLVVLTHQVYGNVFSLSEVSVASTRIAKFKKYFLLQNSTLPQGLKSLFVEKFEGFEKSGYKFLKENCLINNLGDYAVCPISLQVAGKDVDQLFMLFRKDTEWQYIGILNQGESDLFLKLASEMSHSGGFSAAEVLPFKRKIDGKSNPFVNQSGELSFMVNLGDQGIAGRLQFDDYKTIREVYI